MIIVPTYVIPDSFSTFGDLLKYLRRRARLTQLELSIDVGYSEAQISRLEKNQRLPDLTAFKALFIPSLHLEDEPQLVERLLELAQYSRQEDGPAPGIAPYKGLLFFDESDSELFFGREELTAHLAGHVMDLAMDAASRFLSVVGASGSGKSSLVRAGLAVALRREGWDTRVFTPTADPLRMLDRKLNNATGESEERILVVVDQFEEIFTLCHDEIERIAFIERLLSSAQERSKRTTVVIALRSDFYSHCAQYPALRQAVSAEQEYIGQMTKEELRRAIEEPAQRGGWEFEPGLVDVLLNDIGAQGTSEPEPGALPLLSHALLATWQRRRGRKFTLDGYYASGGVRSAIAETAESVFTDQLNQSQQEIARDVFLRLTELGEGTEDTRRRATLDELVRQSTEADRLRVVLNTLAEARLITLNEDSAEVAHESLIREWHRLHEWLMQDREGLRLHRHLTETAHEWEARGYDQAELYRGARLAQAREWAAANDDRLNAPERAFIAASFEQEEHDALEYEAQRQRELETTQKLAELEKQRAEQHKQDARRLRRRAYYLAGVLVLALIAALTAGGFANRNSTLATQNASIAQTAQANFTRTEAQRLAAEANSMMLSNGDTNLIELLAIRSLTMAYTPAGDAMLAGLTTLEAPPREFRGHTSGLIGVAFSPDGKYLATSSSDKTTRLWDLATGETVQIFSGHTAELGEVEFSPDGKFLITTDMEGTARLWDITSGESVQIFLGHTAWVSSVAFSPDGKYIVTAGGDPTARIWDISTGQTLQILAGHSGLIPRVDFSPDGKYVLTGGTDRTARIWDAATGSEVKVIRMPSETESVTFSPDSKYVAIGNSDNVARLWDLATGQIVREFSGHQGSVQGISFSPDGRFLLTGGADRIAMLWDIATGQTIRTFRGHGSGVWTVTFSPDGRSVATASQDGVARVWNLQTSPSGAQFTGHSGSLYQASFSPDGKQVVTASQDNTARIWNTTTGQTVITLARHTGEVRDALFSPDGKMVLTASDYGTVRLWDAASGEELRRFEGHTDMVNRAAFSPDGKYLVTTSYDDGTARVWDVQTANTITIYSRSRPGDINRVAFSPDSKWVVTSGQQDHTARIWDPMTGEDLRVITTPGGVAGVAFSPDGTKVVTASGASGALLWDIASGQQLGSFIGHQGDVLGVAFSPDGRYVATSGADGTARLWDTSTGQEIRRFTGHTGPIRSVVFSPDGKFILTASEDTTARVWLTDLDETIRAVCAMLTRDLTPEERAQFGISDQGPTCPGS